MDFLTTYRQRAQRAVSRSLFILGHSVEPLRLVINLKNGLDVLSGVYEELVEALRVHPECKVVILVDASTNKDSLASMVRFVHRLDCDIVIRALDICISLPKEQVYRYIYHMTIFSTEVLSKSVVQQDNFFVEVEYNKNTASHLSDIAQFWSYAKELKLVLPEYAHDLPYNDGAIKHWGEQTSQIKTNGFDSELKWMRNEAQPAEPGFQSNKLCRIDQLQVLVGQQQQSCPHKSPGDQHMLAIKSCTRKCTSSMLRMPRIRDVLGVPRRWKRKIQ